jgi:hypothetical protein
MRPPRYKYYSVVELCNMWNNMYYIKMAGHNEWKLKENQIVEEIFHERGIGRAIKGAGVAAFLAKVRGTFETKEEALAAKNKLIKWLHSDDPARGYNYVGVKERYTEMSLDEKIEILEREIKRLNARQESTVLMQSEQILKRYLKKYKWQKWHEKSQAQKRASPER